ncbi:sugar MFS transporter [Emcibacteraceae bacterium]|nr:sugar MFS transporter [Emcibacteraceae bacterium]
MNVSNVPEQNSNNSIVPMIIIGLLFFIFGFVTWLNGSLIPFLRIICDLSDFQALFVTFAFYISYTVMALPMAAILNKTGYRNGMAIGLAIMSSGALLFIPAALSANYILFLIALFVLGTGLTILQTASNPYVVFIGPIESAARRIAVMGVINKFAGVVVPVVFAALILSDLGDASDLTSRQLSEVEITALSERLILPYIYMACALIMLIGLVYFSNLPTISENSNAHDTEDDRKSIFAYPQIILGAIALFANIGMEVIAGDTIGLYGARENLPHFATLTSYTMIFMLVGYFVGIFTIPKYMSQSQALYFSAITGFLCIICISLSSENSNSVTHTLWGWTGLPLLPNPIFFVATMGTANALVWPAIWPLALKGLGKFTPLGSALLVMSVSGGAIIPLVFGKIVDMTDNFQMAYLIGIPCYLLIFLYAYKGHKMRHW